MNKFIEEFQKALDYVNALENNKIYNKYFCYSEEQKQIIKQYDPSADVVILPQNAVDNIDDNNKIYVIPIENVKPIKFVCNDSKDI